MTDYTAAGRVSGVVFLKVSGGRVQGSPAVSLAWELRSRLAAALAGRKRGDVTVYDAQGTPVAIIDAETRVRRELPRA